MYGYVTNESGNVNNPGENNSAFYSNNQPLRGFGGYHGGFYGHYPYHHHHFHPYGGYYHPYSLYPGYVHPYYAGFPLVL